MFLTNILSERLIDNGVLLNSLYGWLGIFIVTIVIILVVVIMNKISGGKKG